MTRKIKIYTTTGMPGTIETNATTLAGLKPLLNDRNINYQGMKMLVGETKNELSMDESVLPEGDFKLYLMPAKTKSGVDFDEMEDTIDAINNRTTSMQRAINQILDIVSNSTAIKSNSPSQAPSNSISMEDQREIDALRDLASGSSDEKWD